MTEQLLTAAQASDLLAMSQGALAQMRYLGTGPKFIKLSKRAVRYRPADLDAWIERSVHTRTESQVAS